MTGGMVAVGIFVIVVAIAIALSRRNKTPQLVPEQAGTTGETTTTPPRTATPAREPVPWAGLVIIVSIAVVVLALIGAGIYNSVEKNRVTTREPQWGEIQKLTLTGTKTRIPWQKGAVRYETHLAKEASSTRRYWLKSGDKQALFGKEDGREGIGLCHGQPCYLWSADGKPLIIEFQWKIKQN